jgi:hypothetical protein
MEYAALSPPTNSNHHQHEKSVWRSFAHWLAVSGQAHYLTE